MRKIEKNIESKLKTGRLTFLFFLLNALAILSSFLNFGIFSIFFSVFLHSIFFINFGFAIYGILKKKYILVLGLLIYLIAYSYRIKLPLESSEKFDTETLSILSYNVEFFKHSSSLNVETSGHKTIEFLNKLNPDILVLQEASYKRGREIKDYKYSFIGYRDSITKSLLTFYSKYPILNKGYIDFPDSINNCIYADILIKEDTIRIYNAHLESFQFRRESINEGLIKNLNNSFSKQVNQARMIKEHIKKNNKPVLICGDFNATSYSLPYRILKNSFNDSFIDKGSGLGTTFKFKGFPFRIDYILYNDEIEILSHKNFNLKLSDHEPILVKFKMNKSI